MKSVSIRVIYVSLKIMLESMNEALAYHQIQPFIDGVFSTSKIVIFPEYKYCTDLNYSRISRKWLSFWQN